MEVFIADIINNSKVPKFIRYGMVVGICLFVIFLGFCLAINSFFILGRIFGSVLIIVFLVIGIYLCIKIARN